MKIEAPVHFNGFRLDPHEARLCHGEEPIPLTPKAFALLSYLAGRPGQLLTKHQLLNAVWEDTLVSDAALTVCIREVRRALQDPARQPRFIETVHRRGYRFIAAVSPADSDQPPTAHAAHGDAGSAQAKIGEMGLAAAQPLAGRELELTQLHDALDGVRSALDGLTDALHQIERPPEEAADWPSPSNNLRTSELAGSRRFGD